MADTHPLHKADQLRNQGQSLKAAESYLQIAESSKLGDLNLSAAAFHMAAVSLKEAQDYARSTKYFEQAAEIYQALSNKADLARVYRDFADLFHDQKDFEAARLRFEQSEELLSDGDPGELAMTQIKLAMTLSLMSREKDADAKMSSALNNVKKSSNPFYLATAYANMGKILINKKHFSEALDYLMGALGALGLESDLHHKRRAEILLAVQKCYQDLDNQPLAGLARAQANEHLGEMDSATKVKVLESTI